MEYRDPFARVSTDDYGQSQAVSFDAGLRAYMLKIYNYMASGLALTGIVAFLIASSPQLLGLFFAVNETGRGGPTGLGILVLIATFVMPIALGLGMNRFSAFTLQACFWAFSALMGVFLSSVLLAYTGESVARAFFITAGTFGAMSIYGYTTKKDLTGMGSFLIMGMFGALIAIVVNMFLGSTALSMAISFIVLICSIGLVAWENQNLKRSYYQLAGHPEMRQKVAVMGALSLYLDFINIFISLLRLFGERR